MKKFLSVALAAVMMLSLAACGSSSNKAESSSEGGSASDKTYIIATDTTFAPFEFTNDKNEFVGIDVDILAAIAKDQGFKYDLQSLGFDAAVAALESGQADGTIAGMSITEERQKKYDFSEAYYDSYVCMAVKKGSDIKGYEDLKGKKVVINVFPSLDTAVCAASVRRFNKEAASLPNTVVLAVSKDLPFAQGRFCTTEGIDKVIPLSAFRCSCFENGYGMLMVDGPLKGLLASGVIVVDEAGKVVYEELVSEITNEPNYEAAIASLKN